MERTLTPSMPIPRIPSTPAIKKFWTRNKIIIFTLIIIVLIAISAGLIYVFKSNEVSPAQSGDTTDLTNQPLYDFTGTIEHIDNNTLTVTNISFINPDPATGNQTVVEKKTTYKFTITDDTPILSSISYVPYSIKSATESASQIESKSSDLKVGQQVSVISKDNIRSLIPGTFTAQSIIIQPGLTMITGTIAEINNNVILLKAAPPIIPSPKDFQITISEDTEIVRYSAPSETPNQKRQLPITALTKGLNINVYTDSNINLNSTTKALKIDIPNNQ